MVLDTANQRIVHLKNIEKKWYGQIVAIKYSYATSLKKLDNARWIEISGDDILITDTENCRIMRLNRV